LARADDRITLSDSAAGAPGARAGVVERRELAPGYTVSRLLKGGWQLAGGHGRIDRAQAVRDMFAYAEAGLDTFDCADIYTGVEELIGGFLREWRAAHPSRPVGIHTKYVPDLGRLGALGPQEVRRTLERSLSRLGVERVDLVQFHWWEFAQPGWLEASQHLAGLQREGKLRLVGVTNFDAARLEALLDAGVPVVSNQVQYSLLDRRPEGRLAALCAARGVQLLCYGALAGGFLSPRWLRAAEPRTPLENRSLTKYKLILDEHGVPPGPGRTCSVEEEPQAVPGAGWAFHQRLLQALAAIGEKHGAPLGAVALRWTLDRPQVAGVVVGARDASHLGDTLSALRLRLDAEDHALLGALLAEGSGPRGEVYALERVPGGRHARIMMTNLGG
jgi:aryl-alcohol dehydrogenase-like predicted oxidoreductase